MPCSFSSIQEISPHVIEEERTAHSVEKPILMLEKEAEFGWPFEELVVDFYAPPVWTKQPQTPGSYAAGRARARGVPQFLVQLAVTSLKAVCDLYPSASAEEVERSS